MSFRYIGRHSITTQAIGFMLLFGLSMNLSGAETDTIYLDETYISGNQELPKVLYILPWKDQQGEAVPAVNPLLGMPEILSPIYPHEYRLEMSYRSLVPDQSSRSSEDSTTLD